MPHYHLKRCMDVDTVQGSETSEREKVKKETEEEEEECWKGRQLNSGYQTPSG